VTLFLLRHLWTVLLHLSLLHTRFGQYVERAYLRAALPTVRAFEIEVLPVPGLDVPEDELVEVGPEPPCPWPVVFDEDAGGYRFADGTTDEGRPCRTCHKPTKPDEVGFCEPCAFAELRERRGA
jgi:hypothetical protein